MPGPHGRRAKSDDELLATLDFRPESLCSAHSPSQFDRCNQIGVIIWSCSTCGKSALMSVACYNRLWEGIATHPKDHVWRVTDLRKLGRP